LYRIAQEALHNARKHAADSFVRVDLAQRDSTLMLTVEDNGPGFDPAARPSGKATGLGLFSMQERAYGLGGTFSIRSAPGSGTRIFVSVPLQ
jgi:signal transduction histidine kinase